MGQVALAGQRVAGRVEQRVAVLGDEQEQQPVDEPQQLAVVVAGVRACRRAERVLELVVGGVGEEAAAECLDRLLDALAQRVERAGAVLAGGAGPALEPAVLGALGLDARLVADEPEQHEVGVDLAGEHRLEVELEVRLAGERDAVAEHAEHEPVGDDPPQPLGRAVEQLLHEAVGALAGGALDARRVRASIGRRSRRGGSGCAATGRRPGRSCPRSRSRAAGRAGRSRARRRGPVASARGSAVRPARRPGAWLAGLVEAGPGAGQPGPRTGDRLAEPLARCEVVVAGPQAVEPGVAVGDPLQQVGRQAGRPRCGPSETGRERAVASRRSTRSAAGRRT